MANFSIKYLKFFLTSVFISISLLQCKGNLSDALDDTQAELTKKEITVTVSQPPVTTEPGGSATISIIMSGPPVSPVTIPIASANTAEGTVDKGSITFDKTDWNVTQIITVTGVNDDIDDGDQVYSIQVGPTQSSDPDFNNTTFQDISFTNQNDDTAGLTVSGGSIDLSEDGLTDSYTIALTSRPVSDVSVAISGDTQVQPDTSTITFTPANWNTARSISLSALDDAIYEASHTGTITHTISTTDPKYSAITGPNVTANIADNDSMPTVSFTSSAQAVSEAAGSVTITVQQSVVTGADTTIPFTISGSSTATQGGGDDYTVTASPVVINAGATTQTITVTINQDLIQEASETIIVDMGTPTNATPGAATSHTVTINDDDFNGPKIVSAEYLDTDSNGRIDHVRMTFDQTLLDSSFDGFNSSGNHNVTTVWSVAGHVNVRMDTRATISITGSITGDTSNDGVIWLAFDEVGSGYDTDSKPDLTANNSTLTGSGGCYIQTDNTNCLNNSFADIVTADVVETDKAEPLIVSIRGNSGSDQLNVTFSEPVDGTTADGTCSPSSPLTEADFQYNNDSGGGNAGLSSAASWADTDGCDGKITVQTSALLASSDINVDAMRAVVASIYDNADNVMGISPTTITGAISPYVLSVASGSTTTLRVTFSEPVDGAQATTLTNYSIAEVYDPVLCTNINLSGTVTQIDTDGTIYELNTGSQCSNTVYRLTVTGTIVDLDEGVPLVDPKLGEFLGAEPLKIINASCLSLNSVKVIFNKGLDAVSAGSADRYKLIGPQNLGAIDSATLTLGLDYEITLTHPDSQNGGLFTIIGSNGIDGDGFDDSALGSIVNSSSAENLQPYSSDRALFIGCGQEIDQFTDGEFARDPFESGTVTNFAYIATYNSDLILGPNSLGNSFTRLDPAGNNPVLAKFTLGEDTTGGRTSNSTATYPFFSIGHSGCTPDSNNPMTGCGPDNENGKGFIASGTLSGSEFLFITGTNSAGNNDYLYWTSDTDNNFTFNYVDLSDTLNSGDSAIINDNMGTESITTLNDRIYWMLPGALNIRPYLIKINNVTAESANGSDSVNLKLRFMYGFGPSSSRPNNAGIIGGTSFSFNSILYIANSGSVYDYIGTNWNCPTGADNTTCENNGGIIRSNNNDPAPCTSSDTCPDWTDITPAGSPDWPKYKGYFSTPLLQSSELNPAMRPVPAFAEFNNNLYMIRNGCTKNMAGSTDIACPAGNEVPQLWRCDPTSGLANDTFCDDDEWSIVADNATSGYTNMDDTNNSKITLLMTNGSYLYVGFDNGADGVKIYRTNNPVPIDEADFDQIGGDGLGDSSNTQIFSYSSTNEGISYYIYVAVGDGSGTLKIYKQKND